MKRVLIVGFGGREHTFGWKLRQSYNVEVFYAPGNVGQRKEMQEIYLLMEQKKKMEKF